MADETKQVDVILGPYRGHRLTMTAADADAAVGAHWATDPTKEHEPPHDPLSDQERTDAMTAATAWAQVTWDTAQGTTPPDPPPPEGGVTRRAMKPEEGEGYKTRQADPVSPERTGKR